MASIRSANKIRIKRQYPLNSPSRKGQLPHPAFLLLPALAALFVSAFSISQPHKPVRYRWTCVTRDAAFAARDGAGALVFDDKMWLLGGWNPDDKDHFSVTGHTNSEVWTATDGAAWTLVNLGAPWEGRHTAGYVVHRGRMWIIGGDPLRGHYQNDVWNTSDGTHWEKIADRVPWAQRALHCTLAFKDKIWVFGGQTIPQFAPEKETFYNDVWRTDDGVKWTKVLDHAPWPPRGMIGGSAVLNGRMWILGGGTYDTPLAPKRNFYNDVWSSVDGVRWEKVLDHAPWEARQYHDVAAFDGRLWVLEGWSGKNRSDVWWSEDGKSWFEVPDTPWPPRHASSIFVYKDALWVVAGNNMTPDAWKLIRIDDAK
jgi:hypothetical protein